ncbi:MAG TPA: peptide deformylase [Actinomycetota bacterium]
MAILPIRTFGDPVLREPARPVERFDDALRRLADDMLQTMYDAPGVGLAGPQIGKSIRLFVFDIGEGPHAVANPVISELSGEQDGDEGCLSVPALYFPLRRYGHARVDGLDPDGNPVTYEGDELMARMLQHETDHLEGMLLLARLDRAEHKRAMAELRDRALGLDHEPH